MAELTINDVKFTNVPNKKAGTKFAAALTQSNIGTSQSVQDYMNSNSFYALLNAVDINWNGIEVAANSYINTTSDLIKFIIQRSNIDLSDYATTSYVNSKITELIGAAPETLDTLEELAQALSENANLSYVTEALATKADANNVYTKNEVDLAIQQIELTPGPQGPQGPAGQNGQNGTNGTNGVNGQDGKSAYELFLESISTTTNNFTIVDHTNFASARHNQLADYYNNYPTEARQDGETWPPFTASAFPWIVINHNFDGNTTLVIKYLGNEVFRIKPSAQVEREDGTHVNRTYSILSLPNDCHLTQFTESVAGNQLLANRNDFEVLLVNGVMTQQEWLESLHGQTGNDGNDGITPHIGLNGNWFIDETDTNVKAQGPAGQDGQNGAPGIDGQNGQDGKSAFELAQDNGFEGTVEQWLESLHGQNGQDGSNGQDGQNGANGVTPHIGLNGNWFIGETDTNVKAQGPAGQDGQNGAPGAPGVDGKDGQPGVDGYTPYIDNTTYNWMINGTDTGVCAKGQDGQNGTVDYSVLNNYVSITSYNNLMARVEQLASWIVSYHGGSYVGPGPSTGTFALNTHSISLDNTYMLGQDVYVMTNTTGIDTSIHPVQWYIDSLSVASLGTISNSQCTVSYVGEGNAQLTATLTDGNNTYTEYVNISCTAQHAPAGEFRLDVTNVDLYSGGPNTSRTIYVSTNTTGIDTTTYHVTWSSEYGYIRIVSYADDYCNIEYSNTGYDSLIATLSDGVNTYTARVFVHCDTYVSPKSNPSLNFYNTSLGFRDNDFLVVSGDTTSYELFLDETPSGNWTLKSDPMISGITIDMMSTPKKVIINPEYMTPARHFIEFESQETIDYNYGVWSLSVGVLRPGANKDFYYFPPATATVKQGTIVNYTPINNTQYNDISYSSSDTSIVTVNSGGTMNYVSAGNCIITATLRDGNGNIVATAELAVTAEPYVIKTYPSLSWTNTSYGFSGNSFTVTSGDTTSYVMTFNGTPSTGWSLKYDPMISGITIDMMSTPNTITIDPQYMTPGNYYMDFEYYEDTNYYYNMSSFSLKVLPVGANPNFYYEESMINLDNMMNTSQTPVLHNTGTYSVVYSSSDTNVATVDANGMISYVGPGTCTITANTSLNGSDPVYASITVYCNQQKGVPNGSWKDSNMSYVYSIDVVEGDSTVRTYYFEGTPASGWTFNDPMQNGITVDSSTGTITIDASHMATSEFTISAYYAEDSSYYMGSQSITIHIWATGTNLDFHFDRNSISLDNVMSTSQTLMLYNNLIGGNNITYSSSDTNIATVDSYGTITYQGPGTCTVTATATNSGGTVATATITVYCTRQKEWSNASWHDENMNQIYAVRLTADDSIQHTYSLNGYPADSWQLTDPQITGVTVDNVNNTITIVPSTIGEQWFSVTANRQEDSSYYSGTNTLDIRILPIGTNINFYYDQGSISLDNMYTTSWEPTLFNTTGYYDIEYSSSDDNVAWVNTGGGIYYVGPGTCTVTATLLDALGGNTVATATIDVNCYNNEPYEPGIDPGPSYMPPSGDWQREINGTPQTISELVFRADTGDSHEVTFVPYGPGDGWTIQIPSIDGVTIGNTPYDVLIDSTRFSHDQRFTIDAQTDGNLEYSSGTISLSVRVIGTAGNVDFYYQEIETYVDNYVMTLVTPTLVNNTPYSDIVYSSSNTNVASVDQYGNISYVGPGTCTVTATVRENGYSYANAEILVYSTYNEPDNGMGEVYPSGPSGDYPPIYEP